MRTWLAAWFVAGLVCLPAVAEEQGGAAAPAKVAAPGAASELDQLILTGQQALRTQRWKDAAGAFEKAIKLAPGNGMVRFGLATACIQLRDYAQASRVLDAMLVEFPDNPEVKNNLAWICLKSDDPKIHDLPKAKRLAQDAVLQSSTDQNIWNTLAEVHYAQGDFGQALRAARIAMQFALDAGDPNVLEYQDLVARAAKKAGVSSGNP